MSVETIVFDVGETLADESRLWGLWADWLEVPRETFLGELESIIRRRRHHREVFDAFASGFDLDVARRARAQAGWPPDALEPRDLYPDVLPCVTKLKERGYRLEVAANQSSSTLDLFRALDLPFDFVHVSESWGVAKPSGEFFARVIRACGRAGSEIAYVGTIRGERTKERTEGERSATTCGSGATAASSARSPCPGR